MYASRGLPISIEDVSSRIRTVVRNTPTLCRKIANGQIDQSGITGSAEPIADHEFGRSVLWMGFPQRRHRMQVNQEHIAPPIAQPFQFTGQSHVIGPVNPFDPAIELGLLKWLPLDFPHAGNAAWYEAQSIA